MTKMLAVLAAVSLAWPTAAAGQESGPLELGVEALISRALLAAAGKDITSLDLVELQLRGVAHPISALAVEKAATLPALLSGDAGTTQGADNRPASASGA